MMDFVTKLETRVLTWARNVPHLPAAGQKWLGVNMWWIVLIGAIFSGFSFLYGLSKLLTLISLIGAVSSAYYVTGNYTSLAILNEAVNVVFITGTGLLLALAVKPLQHMQKKGWVLMFMTLLVEALSVVVGAVLSFSVVGFIINLLFGGIALAIGAYFIAEIHGQFSHHAKATIKKL